MSENATDNDDLFRATRHRQEAAQPIASRSWWMESDCRQAFTDAAEREQRRMQRGPGAKLARGMVVGNFRTVTGGK